MFPTGFTRGMNPVNLFRRFGGTLLANRLFLLTGVLAGAEASVEETVRRPESLCCCSDFRDSLLPVGEPTILSFSSSFSSTPFLSSPLSPPTLFSSSLPTPFPSSPPSVPSPLVSGHPCLPGECDPHVNPVVVVLQVIIRMGRPFANDHPDGLAFCE